MKIILTSLFLIILFKCNAQDTLEISIDLPFDRDLTFDLKDEIQYSILDFQYALDEIADKSLKGRTWRDIRKAKDDIINQFSDTAIIETKTYWRKFKTPHLVKDYLEHLDSLNYQKFDIFFEKFEIKTFKSLGNGKYDLDIIIVQSFSGIRNENGVNYCDETKKVLKVNAKYVNDNWEIIFTGLTVKDVKASKCKD